MKFLPEILTGIFVTALLATIGYMDGHVPTLHGAIIVFAPFGVGAGFWTACVRTWFRGPSSSVSRPQSKTGKVCGYHDGCPMDGPVCHLCAHLQPGAGK